MTIEQSCRCILRSEHSLLRFLENLSTVTVTTQTLIGTDTNVGLPNINTREEYNAFLRRMSKENLRSPTKYNSQQLHMKF